MSGLGAGLARGLAAFGQGRMFADEREAQRQQQEAERKRQAEKDKQDAEYRKLMMTQMTDQMQRNKAQDGIAAEGRTNEAVGRGFRPVGDQWDTFNDMVGIDPSKAETITVNGQQMRKVAPTQQFQDGMRQKREQDATLLQATQAQREQFEALRSQLPASIRPLATDLKSAQALATKVAEQRMAPPRQESPVNFQRFESDQGMMLMDPRTGRVQPMMANGQPVRGPAAKPRQLPNAVIEDLRTNQKTINVINDALSGLTSNPDAVGVKNYVPDVALNQLGIKGWRDGVEVRANVGDIGSLVVKDRSGASVTASESPRLKPFIPSASDDAKTATKKLQRMLEIIKNDTDLIKQYYGGDEPGAQMQGTTDPDMANPQFLEYLANVTGRKP